MFNDSNGRPATGSLYRVKTKEHEENLGLCEANPYEVFTGTIMINETDEETHGLSSDILAGLTSLQGLANGIYVLVRWYMETPFPWTRGPWPWNHTF